MTSTTAYIGLGSNLGDRQVAIQRAIEMLAATERVELLRVSDVIETVPLGHVNQPKYLNAVAEVRTTLSAEDLHKNLFQIEISLGRQRQKKWSARTIDLDLLLFDQKLINLPHITVPHPQMHLRSFVLKGLHQLNPDLLHPGLNETVSELIARLRGADFALNPELPQLVSVAGIIGVGKTTLAKKLAEVLGCRILLEPYDSNPFMPEVYAGRQELALDSQLWFLASRVEQLNANTLAAGQIAVSDYVFDKERIYTKSLLNAHQLTLYEEIYGQMAEKVASPVLVIYLLDSVENCLRRIHQRNRPYEQEIEPTFLRLLRSRYEQLFDDWKICPVIRILVSEFDFLKEANIERLAYQIRHYVAVQTTVSADASVDA